MIFDVMILDPGHACNGKRMTCCEVENGEVTKTNLLSKCRRGPCSYTLIKRYYKHATAGDFKRTIAELIGMCNIHDDISYTCTAYNMN